MLYLIYFSALKDTALAKSEAITSTSNQGEESVEIYDCKGFNPSIQAAHVENDTVITDVFYAFRLF